MKVKNIPFWRVFSMMFVLEDFLLVCRDGFSKEFVF